MSTAAFIALAIGAIALVIWSRRREQKRVRALQQYALANGWTYVARDDSLCGRWYRTPFNQGFDRRANNVLTGRYRERDLLAFDYTYKTRSTDSRGHETTTTHRYRICSLALPVWLPRLQVTEETLFTRLGHAIGMQDIEFESEAFNRRFRIKASDPKFAFDVLSPRTIEKLLALPAHQWRIDGSAILSWADGSNDVTDLPARLNTLATVIDGIPDFVWHDNGVEPSTSLSQAPLGPPDPGGSS